jgi:hypothetical protein
LDTNTRRRSVIELSCLHLIEHLFDPIKAAFPLAAISLEPIANFD